MSRALTRVQARRQVRAVITMFSGWDALTDETRQLVFDFVRALRKPTRYAISGCLSDVAMHRPWLIEKVARELSAAKVQP